MEKREGRSEPIPEVIGEPIPKVAHLRRGPVEYATFGQGPAVLALHGAMGGYDQSAILARTIGEAGYRYICVSRPGYLGTPLSVGARAEEQADLCAELLDVLGVESAAVITVSGGGPCALQFALRHRSRCWGLVPVSTCSGRIEGGVPLAFRIMKLLARWRGFGEMMRKRAGSNPEKAAQRSIPDPILRRKTVQDPVAGPLLLALTLSTLDRMWCRLQGTENDIAVTRETDYPLEQIQVPVLVVHGTGDRIVPFVPHAPRFRDRVPGAQLLAIEGGDHVTIFTHRKEVRERVTRFLREHAPVAVAVQSAS